MTRLNPYVLAAALLMLFSPARAQMGAQNIPDLSGIADAISGAAGSSAAPPAGSSPGLPVPRVHPGQTATEIAHQLRASVEAKTGPNPALAKLEAAMPQAVTQLDGQMAKLGFAPRDFSTAVAFAFVTDWETARGSDVPQAAEVRAGHVVAAAVARRWGPKYKALPPAAQEKAYESLLISTFLLSTFAAQFDKAGKTEAAAGLRRTAGDVFQKLVGVPPAQVQIDADGRITGLAGNTKPPSAPSQTGSVPPAHGDLKPSQIAGVYARQVMEGGVGGGLYVVFDPVLALKDGTYCMDFDVPPSDCNAAASRHAHPRDWGRWRGTLQHIQTLNDRGQREKANWIGPLSGGGPGQKLSGTFTSLGGGGNTAFGGSTIVAVQHSFTFSPDGTFRTEGSVSASSGGGMNDSGARVAIASNSHAHGTYTLGNYALTLHFADGTVQRFSYAKMDADMVYIHGARFINDKKL